MTRLHGRRALLHGLDLFHTCWTLRYCNLTSLWRRLSQKWVYLIGHLIINCILWLKRIRQLRMVVCRFRICSLVLLLYRYSLGRHRSCFILHIWMHLSLCRHYIPCFHTDQNNQLVAALRNFSKFQWRFCINLQVSQWSKMPNMTSIDPDF